MSDPVFTALATVEKTAIRDRHDGYGHRHFVTLAIVTDMFDHKPQRIELQVSPKLFLLVRRRFQDDGPRMLRVEFLDHSEEIG